MSGRSICEEVTETQKPAATPGALTAGRGRGRGFARIWLMVLFAMVVAMIAVGGLTRLTDSGLSITEWAPISGAVPPLNEADWQSEFEAYQQTDEYRLQNAGMSVAEFQYIYWWEWGHRQLGRTIGLVWALGFAFMLVTKRMPTGWTGRFLLLGALGGAQGAIGWWMVHSGLQEGMLDVASYRLATHLGLAFLILALIAWYVLRLMRDEAELMQARRNMDRKIKGMVTGLLHLSFVQILLGALVAGIDAGRMFPDWPLMSGGFFPPDMWQIEPLWRNFFENAGTVQFIRNTADATIFGAEVDGVFPVTDNLVILASGGYLDASYDEGTEDLNGDGVVDGADKSLDLPRAPELTYSIGSTYDMDIGSWGFMTARINYAHRDEMAYTDSNFGFINEVDILDAGLDFQSNSGEWIFSLYGRNLLDEVSHGGDTQLPDTIGPVSAGGTFSPLTPGIRVGAEVTYNFM